MDANSDSLLTNLEYFLRDQRSKLEKDKEKLDKSTSPRSDTDERLHRRDTSFRHRTSACQTDISLPNPRTDRAAFNDSMFDYGSPPDPPPPPPPPLSDFDDARHNFFQLNELLEERERRKTRSAPVDYVDLLARKREEEARYRYFNHFGPRETYSGGYLYDKQLRNNNNYNYLQGFDRNSAVDELGELLARLRTEVVDRRPSASKTSPSLFVPTAMIPEKDASSKPSFGVVPQGGQSDRRTVEERQRVDTYRLELEEQIREQKERKKRLLAEERASAVGAALPFGDDAARQLAKQTERRQTFVREEPARTDDGVRRVPDKWHEGYWPLPESNKPSDRRKADYQEELRTQIEDKKRREREEKAEQRREEEKLARKLEEDRVKIQREFEAEQRRQARKEEEARANAEALVRNQEKQRQERRRSSDTDKEWWEKKVVKTSSPRLAAAVAAAAAAAAAVTSSAPSSAPSSAASSSSSSHPSTPRPRIHTPKSSRESWRLSVPDSPPGDGRVSTSTGVLGQLSAMRRRLQDEQQRMSNKTQVGDQDDDYEVFDKRKQKSFSVQDISTRNRQRRDRLTEWKNDEDYDTSLSES